MIENVVKYANKFITISILYKFSEDKMVFFNSTYNKPNINKLNKYVIKIELKISIK